MAQPKELNFNEIEREQLLDAFIDDDDECDTEHVDITEFCLDLDNNEVIDDDKFNFMEV
tara:strand:- start:330 stop:506 length:177 start_codon:yes stop_codon:yes gene_type:complete